MITGRWWDFVLEVSNGVGAIAYGWLGAFLAYHLVVVGAQRRIWRFGWIRLPLSMQLAVAFLVISLGIFGQRLIIWIGRYFNGSVLALDAVQTGGFILATLIAIIGPLCALRVVTRPMLGRWPWHGALLTIFAYLAWSIWRLV